MIEPFTIVGLGEILWDLLPTGRALGGAPSNFAYCSSLLGDTGIVASRIGADGLGNDIRESLATFGLSDDFLQIDTEHPTGTVHVELNKRGHPKFEISYPAAWDFLQWDRSLQHLAKTADAVCFGSLAQRSPESCKTIRTFLENLRPQAVRVFDVNLRQSFYSAEVIESSMQQASIVKMNEDEVSRVAELLQMSSNGLAAFSQQVLQRFQLDLICVTRGERGSSVVDKDGTHEHPGFRVEVRDTVGSGDAFTAALVHQYLRGKPADIANDFANRMGAWVASCSGAMPPRPEGGLDEALARLGQADLP